MSYKNQNSPSLISTNNMFDFIKNLSIVTVYIVHYYKLFYIFCLDYIEHPQVVEYIIQAK